MIRFSYCFICEKFKICIDIDFNLIKINKFNLHNVIIFWQVTWKSHSTSSSSRLKSNHSQALIYSTVKSIHFRKKKY